MDAYRLGDDLPSPDILWHYTSVESLLGILQHGRIWATSVGYMNDRSELRHFLDEVLRIVKAILDPSYIPPLTAYIETAMASIFAVSTSATPDSLSQWRSYGMYAIAFRSNGLSQLMAEPNTSGTGRPRISIFPASGLGRVIYSDKRSLPAMSVEMVQFNANQVSRSSSIPIDRQLEELASLMVGTAARIKHDGFREEQEWRFVPAAPTSAKLYFRSGRYGLTPYLKLGSAAGVVDPSSDCGSTGTSASSRLPIERIVVGPVPEQETALAGVRLLLADAGWPLDVAASDIPYR